jgi:hypothetical protein
MSARILSEWLGRSNDMIQGGILFLLKREICNPSSYFRKDLTYWEAVTKILKSERMLPSNSLRYAMSSLRRSSIGAMTRYESAKDQKQAGLEMALKLAETIAAGTAGSIGSCLSGKPSHDSTARIVRHLRSTQERDKTGS